MAGSGVYDLCGKVFQGSGGGGGGGCLWALGTISGTLVLQFDDWFFVLFTLHRKPRVQGELASLCRISAPGAL